MKFLTVPALVFLSMFFLTGCGEERPERDVLALDWEEVSDTAEGTTVRFYGWGGAANINTWLETTLAAELRRNHDITLERVSMPPGEYLPKLLNEKQLGSRGTMDIIWINGENFFLAQSKGLLFGPFSENLPNFQTYIDADSPDVRYDFGHPVEGWEAPYGKAQFVLIGDSGKLESFPDSHTALLEAAKAHPGRFTYPEITDFTGSAFVRNIIYDVVGWEPFIEAEADEEILRPLIQPAMDFLKELKPFLWNRGETYPSTIAQLDNLYADGEVWITMNYAPFHAAYQIAQGVFPETTKTFLFEKGTIGNTHFLAVPFNAPNKAAALAAINLILSPEIQATKYDPSVWGDLPVTDPSKLTASQKKAFDGVVLGDGVLPQQELLTRRMPEMPAALIPVIEKIWTEEILGR